MNAINTKVITEPVGLPATGFVRIPLILAVIPIGKSTWWAGVKSGRFPQPVRPSPFGRVAVWRAEDIRDLVNRAGGEMV